MTRRGSADTMNRTVGTVGTVTRILLIVPSLGPQRSAATGGATPDTGVVVESLRAAGFQAEVYDAADSVVGTETIGLHIEHSFPQVVVIVAQNTTGEAAGDISRIAKEIVPGVFTVVLGARPAQTPGREDKAVDCVVSDHFERLPSLLTCLRSGQPVPIAEC
jgi:hypothetical protein